jgi:hypothetical protein
VNNVRVPDAPGLEQNYPNPFNPATTITYRLPAAGHVTLVIYDILGREVARPVDAAQSAGAHDVFFAARNLAAGVYVYRLTSPAFSTSRTMILLK